MRGKSEFRTMDCPACEAKEIDNNDIQIKGIDDLEDSIVLKETSNELYHRRFYESGPGKNSFKDPEGNKDWIGLNEETNNLIKEDSKWKSRKNPVDDAVKDRRRQIRDMDRGLVDASATIKNRMGNQSTDITRQRTKNLLGRMNARKEQLAGMFRSPPEPVNVDAEKYSNALIHQLAGKVKQQAKNIKRNNLLKVIKEFSIDKE